MRRQHSTVLRTLENPMFIGCFDKEVNRQTYKCLNSKRRVVQHPRGSAIESPNVLGASLEETLL